MQSEVNAWNAWATLDMKASQISMTEHSSDSTSMPLTVDDEKFRPIASHHDSCDKRLKITIFLSHLNNFSLSLSVTWKRIFIFQFHFYYIYA